MTRSAPDFNDVLASAFVGAGATTAFGVPGGGNNLDLIGALEAEGLRFVLCHAETTAAIMAAVHGDLTGAPTPCVVTRGPGAASAVNGVANAMLDRQQLVLVTDAVPAADAGRIAHQRIDQRALFAPVVKWSATIGTGDAPATARAAIDTAMAHPRGPVHLDVDATAPSTPPVPAAPQAARDATAMRGTASLLAQSTRPVVVLGGGARSVVRPVRTLLQRTSAPVLMTYRGKGVVPDSWPNAAGLFSGAATEGPLLEQADAIVMIGVDTVEIIPGAWRYQAPVVSVNSWHDSSLYLEPDVELVGDLEQLVDLVADGWPTTDWPPDAGRRHRLQERSLLISARPDAVDGLCPQDLVEQVRSAAPAGTIATVDAGAHMLPCMCLWDTEDCDEVLISSGLATMGFALPAAIGAALARPGRRVVCFTGDGGLGMSLGELETLRRLELPVTVVVFNDARLSLIAIKARPEGNGGRGAVTYADTDFAAVAQAYGLEGRRAVTVDELDDALRASFASPGPALVDVRVDPTGYPDIVSAIRAQRLTPST